MTNKQQHAKDDPIPQDGILSETPPDNYVDRVRFFAKALAYGATKGHWTPTFFVQNDKKLSTTSSNPHGLALYIMTTWKSGTPESGVLQTFGFFELINIDEVKQFWHKKDSDLIPRKEYSLTEKAFDLLNPALDRKVFISYKRSESSAFALLLRDRLEKEGFDAFIDMQNIDPGATWEEVIKHEITIDTDVFISLLAPNTLDSDNVANEIRWALGREGLISIPVWHNGFEGFDKDKTSHTEFEDFLNTKNAIIVDNEHVMDYESAITQLIQFLKKAH